MLHGAGPGRRGAPRPERPRPRRRDAHGVGPELGHVGAALDLHLGAKARRRRRPRVRPRRAAPAPRRSRRRRACRFLLLISPTWSRIRSSRPSPGQRPRPVAHVKPDPGEVEVAAPSAALRSTAAPGRPATKRRSSTWRTWSPISTITSTSSCSRRGRRRPRVPSATQGQGREEGLRLILRRVIEEKNARATSRPRRRPRPRPPTRGPGQNHAAPVATRGPYDFGQAHELVAVVEASGGERHPLVHLIHGGGDEYSTRLWLPS